MGNSPAHAYIYDQLLRHPGVVVMHEFVLHHLRMWMTLNTGKRKAYLALMDPEAEEPVEVAIYCPTCAEFDLGDDASAAAS